MVLAALLALAGLCAPAWAADPTFPALTGRVVDAANIIPPDEELRLDQKLAALEAQSRRQLVVATLPDLQGYEIADYSNRLFRAWGLGSKERNDGILLVVAPNERKLRIEVGYGMEGIVTDGLSSLIIQNVIVPRFKAGDMPGGIEAGTDALIHQLNLPEDEARQIAAQPTPAQTQNDDPGWYPIAFFAFLFFIMFVLPALTRSRRDARFRSSGIGNIVLWSVLEGLSNARSSSGGSGSFGGGFSGGGGSSGGGGASGSW